ncbi:MAG: hypothetical protein JWO07_542 [Candidatus Saccharibacteria bacterium]|nr:hypothetical protein [Candidatus Saccharibacteria bacterium]
MGKFVFVYYGGSSANGGSAEEWGAWFGQLGSKLIDGGNQFGPGAQAVSKAGVMDVKEMPATGYSIVSAENMDEARELAKGCPLVAADNAAVCVYEALPM